VCPSADDLNTAAYGLYLSNVRRVVDDDGASDDAHERLASIVHALVSRGQREDGLTRALIELRGREGMERLVARLASMPERQVVSALDDALHRDFLLTGAEAIALLLAAHRVALVFAYAGTSELALCDAVARSPGIELVNGRGDKESAFMAGGASLLRPCTGAAIIHAARGLTNACGAIADLRRSEIGNLVVVGLPSLASAQFLPPHAEPGLLVTIGKFAKWSYDPTALLAASGPSPDAAEPFLAKLGHALRLATTRPYGPVLFGLPQDAAEQPWLPWKVVSDALAPIEPDEADCDAVAEATGLERLRTSHRPLILIDDYLLKYPDARPALRDFASALSAPVLQLRYTRGAMLFERLSWKDVPQFIGWYEQGDPAHQRLLAESDLIVTIEDRNMYARVLGPFPERRKLAINSSEEKVRKNLYLTDDDVLIVGNAVETLRRLTEQLRPAGDRAASWAGEPTPAEEPAIDEAVSSPAAALRAELAGALALALGEVERPILVDDSQMLGGLLCEQYDRLPVQLRVHGSHGGFVGSGLATATGLALAEPDAVVVCTLGDQGFTNGVQGLAVAGQEGAPVTYVVCNNGGAISLEKQACSDDERAFDGGRHRYLGNAPNVDYLALAEAFGIAATSIRWSPEDGAAAIERAGRELAETLADALASREPRLIELQLPPLGDTWDGVWAIAGREPAKVANPQPAS
jgi:acetolactate synthase I/II/III large subunit